jgi:hypothetical protein
MPAGEPHTTADNAEISESRTDTTVKRGRTTPDDEELGDTTTENKQIGEKQEEKKERRREKRKKKKGGSDEKEKPKRILYWNDFYGSRNFGFCCGKRPYLLAGCKNTNCQVLG